jgi:hypothetical protein
LPEWRVEGLNDKQAEAVASALGRDTTFIWGPPGTGKTRTIGKIGEQLVRAGRSVLVVSHTNSAVDQALGEIADDLGNALVDGTVLRLGETKDQRLKEGRGERLRAETHIRERSQELLERKQDLLAEQDEKTAQLARVQRILAIAEWVMQASAELDGLRALVGQQRQAEREAAAAQETAKAATEAHQAQIRVAERARELAKQVRDAQPLHEELARRQALLVPAEERLHEAERLAREAGDLFEQIAATGGVMRRLRGLPKLPEQERIVGERRAAETGARDERDQISERLAEVREPLLELEGQLRAFEAERGMPLDVVVQSADETEAAALHARAVADACEAQADALCASTSEAN